MNACIRHLKHAEKACIDHIPKCHQFTHLCQRISYSGHPSLAATFIDESDNRKLADIAKLAYSVVFEQRVLLYWRSAYVYNKTGRSLGPKRKWLEIHG